jgi:hypothetical protein
MRFDVVVCLRIPRVVDHPASAAAAHPLGKVAYPPISRIIDQRDVDYAVRR